MTPDVRNSMTSSTVCYINKKHPAHKMNGVFFMIYINNITRCLLFQLSDDTFYLLL